MNDVKKIIHNQNEKNFWWCWHNPNHNLTNSVPLKSIDLGITSPGSPSLVYNIKILHQLPSEILQKTQKTLHYALFPVTYLGYFVDSDRGEQTNCC